MTNLWWLNILGGAFALLGTAVLFLDLRGDKIATKAAQLQLYAGLLEQQIEELEDELKQNGPTPPGGEAIDEALDLLYQSAKLANRKNRDMHLRLLDEVMTEAHRHRRAQVVAIALVVIGGCCQLIATLF